MNVHGFVVFAPDFQIRSAGIYCLHALGEALRERGFAAYLCGARRGAPGHSCPLVSRSTARALCHRGAAAVYPETVLGNPFGARTVMRWVMNRPGLLGGSESYGSEERVFAYSEVFRPYIRNHLQGVLYMPAIDQSLFFPPATDWARTLDCFYVGKSRWREHVLDRAHAFEITRESPPRCELGKILRHSRRLFCFDNSTLLIYEALLCGCEVVVVPDGTHTRADFQKLELGTDGIAWGVDECGTGRVDVDGLQHRIAAAQRAFPLQLEAFLAASEQRPDPSSIATIDAWVLSREQRLATIHDTHGARAIRRAYEHCRTAERAFRRWRRSLFRTARSDCGAAVHSAGDCLVTANCNPPEVRSITCHHFMSAASDRMYPQPDESVSLGDACFASPQSMRVLLSHTSQFTTDTPDSALAALAATCGCRVVHAGAGHEDERSMPHAGCGTTA